MSAPTPIQPHFSGTPIQPSFVFGQVPGGAPYGQKMSPLSGQQTLFQSAPIGLPQRGTMARQDSVSKTKGTMLGSIFIGLAKLALGGCITAVAGFCWPALIGIGIFTFCLSSTKEGEEAALKIAMGPIYTAYKTLETTYDSFKEAHQNRLEGRPY